MLLARASTLLRSTTLRQASALRPSLPRISPCPRISAAALHTTPIRRASEDPRMIPPGMEKLLESPEAMAAIERLFQLLETKGINVKSGRSPSMLKLARVAADSEVRQVMGEVFQTLNEAGVDVSKERMEQILSGNPFGENQEGEANEQESSEEGDKEKK